MNLTSIARVASAAIFAVALAGCSYLPSRPEPSAIKNVAEAPPSWKTYYVTGSRIARRMDRTGKPASADYVQSTTVGGLGNMPGVTLNTKGY